MFYNTIYIFSLEVLCIFDCQSDIVCVACFFLNFLVFYLRLIRYYCVFAGEKRHSNLFGTVQTTLTCWPTTAQQKTKYIHTNTDTYILTYKSLCLTINFFCLSVCCLSVYMQHIAVELYTDLCV